MYLIADQIENLKPYLESARGGYAPRIIWSSMVSLAGDSAPLASTCSHRSIGGTIHWSVLWLIPGALVYAEASKQADSWIYSTTVAEQSEEPVHLMAWRQPTSQIERLEVEAIELAREARTSWSWRLAGRIVLCDGQILGLPLSEKATSGDDEDAEQFITHLRQFLS
jgi:hypothetical protein